VLEHVTPSIASELLDRYSLRAGVRHGQHFLVDPNTVRRIVRLAKVEAGETILEIGPGLGSLTVALAQAAGRVVAIEIDSTVASALREVVRDAPNVELVVGDAMRIDISAYLNGPARLVANLPYNVATPLFVRVLSEWRGISGGLVMVQRELGERWTAGPGSRVYGSVSVRTRYHADARIVGEVPRSVFMPPPKVASVLVAFDRLQTPPVNVNDERAFFAFVQAAFAHRRKTLRNSLSASGYAKETVGEVLVARGMTERARPEDLSLDDFAHLHRALT
jgi:16S rRNA (adenine1518-N6/adenine1519-N6)-dimethyltransferase